MYTWRIEDVIKLATLVLIYYSFPNCILVFVLPDNIFVSYGTESYIEVHSTFIVSICLYFSNCDMDVILSVSTTLEQELPLLIYL